MIPQRISSHPDEAAALLTEKWRGKRVTEGLLRALVKPCDGIEAAAWDTLEGRVLGAPGCQGFWLDAIGSLVVEPRNGRDDANYLAAIRVRIRVNRSQGRAIDVIEVARLFDTLATYVEYFPLAWEVSIYDTALGRAYIAALTQTKAITSYGVLLTSTWPTTSVFKWSHAGDSASNPWDSVTVGTSQLWPSALPTNR